MSRAGAVVASALGLASPASPAVAGTPAGPPPVAPAVVPDAAAVDAGDANLESTASRRGIVVTVGVGAALTIGFGINDSTGSGGAGTLRVARVASPRALVTLEILGSALFHQVRTGDVTETFTNRVTNLLVGGQYYVNNALWLRAALGIGGYVGVNVVLEPRPGEPAAMRGDVRYVGPAGSVGAGLDLARFRRVRIGAEICSTAILTRDGPLSSSGFLLAVSID